jgi:hypothetical protein
MVCQIFTLYSTYGEAVAVSHVSTTFWRICSVFKVPIFCAYIDHYLDEDLLPDALAVLHFPKLDPDVTTAQK